MQPTASKAEMRGQGLALRPWEGLLLGLVAGMVIWGVVQVVRRGLGVGLGVGLATRTASGAAKYAVGGLIGGALAAVAYPLAVALVMPATNTDALLPEEAAARLLWLAMLAGMIGLVVPAADRGRRF